MSKFRRALVGVFVFLSLASVSAGVTMAAPDKDCSDFTSHPAAQDYFESIGGSRSYNADNLDQDSDGLACELLPAAGSTSSSSSSSSSSSRPSSTTRPSGATRSSSTTSTEDGGRGPLEYGVLAAVVITASAWAYTRKDRFNNDFPPNRPVMPIGSRDGLSPSPATPYSAGRRGTTTPTPAPVDGATTGWPTVSQARARELEHMAYVDYLHTPEWRQRALFVKRKAGGKCQTWGRAGTLHAHHNSYERRGNEQQGDLIALCDRCHRTFHQTVGMPV